MDSASAWFRDFLPSVLQNWISIVAASISIVSAFAAAAQNRRQLRMGWNRDVMAWAREAMAAIAAAHMEFRLHDNSLDRRSDNCLAMQKSISAAIDQGRLFFENKEGLRPEILDPLVCILKLLQAEGETFEGPIAEIVDVHRRNFWRRVQKAVDPAWMRSTAQGSDSQAGKGSHEYARPIDDATPGTPFRRTRSSPNRSEGVLNQPS